MNDSDRKQRGAAKTARIPVKIEPTLRPQRINFLPLLSNTLF